MKHCSNCGKELSPESRFCTACGTPVQPPAAQGQPVPPQGATPGADAAPYTGGAQPGYIPPAGAAQPGYNIPAQPPPQPGAYSGGAPQQPPPAAPGQAAYPPGQAAYPPAQLVQPGYPANYSQTTAPQAPPEQPSPPYGQPMPPPAYVQYAAAPPPEAPAKKRKSPLFITMAILIPLLVVAAAGFAVWFFFLRGGDDGSGAPGSLQQQINAQQGFFSQEYNEGGAAGHARIILADGSVVKLPGQSVDDDISLDGTTVAYLEPDGDLDGKNQYKLHLYTGGTAREIAWGVVNYRLSDAHNRVYYLKNDGGLYMYADGAETRLATDVERYVFSIDDAYVLYLSGGALYRLPDGGTAEQLATVTDDTELLGISVDGQTYYYAEPDEDRVMAWFTCVGPGGENGVEIDTRTPPTLVLNYSGDEAYLLASDSLHLFLPGQTVKQLATGNISTHHNHFHLNYVYNPGSTAKVVTADTFTNMVWSVRKEDKGTSTAWQWNPNGEAIHISSEVTQITPTRTGALVTFIEDETLYQMPLESGAAGARVRIDSGVTDYKVSRDGAAILYFKQADGKNTGELYSYTDGKSTLLGQNVLNNLEVSADRQVCAFVADYDAEAKAGTLMLYRQGQGVQKLEDGVARVFRSYNGGTVLYGVNQKADPASSYKTLYDIYRHSGGKATMMAETASCFQY